MQTMSEGQLWYRRSHLQSAHWKRIKRKVIIRDYYICSISGCDKRSNLEFHHLSYENVGIDRETEDVRIVCATHHFLCHHRWGRKLSLTRDILTKRYNELGRAVWRRIRPSAIMAGIMKMYTI